jgi:probable F420-dependent oxidoreductase
MPAIGLFGANMGAAATAEGVARIASLAEDLGYESLWMGEHVVVPRPRTPPSMIEPDYPLLDPLVALALAAAHTRTVRLATGIVILPQRNPVVLAKQVASLDVLSAGRLILGIGVGYVEAEMRAVGVPMEGRGARADDYLSTMRALWAGQVDGVDAYPRPLQDPLPVIAGGHTPAAHRRAARNDGWFGFFVDRKTTAEHIAALPDGLSITIAPAEPLDANVIADYEELGVERLVALPPMPYWSGEMSLDELEDFMRDNARWCQASPPLTAAH